MSGRWRPVGTSPVDKLARRDEDCQSFFRDIREFHQKFGLEYNAGPRPLPADLQKFRTDFIEEELDEYRSAITSVQVAQEVGNPEALRFALIKAFDALVDITYVTLGAAYLHGFNFDEGWRRVHAANMRKVRAHPSGVDSKRASGFDVVKPVGWEPPQYEDLVPEERAGLGGVLPKP